MEQSCRVCEISKPLTTDYYHFRQDSQKYRTICRECHKQCTKRRYNNRTEEQVSQDSRRYMSTPANIRLWKLAKKRSEKKGIDFDIAPDDIIVPSHCPVFPDIELKSSCLDDCPSLDRFDNSLGYVVGNIRVISHRANSIKGFATAEELYRVADYASGRL